MKNILSLQKIFAILISLVVSLPLYASDNNYDVRISPGLLLLGITDVEINVKLNKNITVAPMYTHWSSSILEEIADEGDDFSLKNYGVRAYWHLNGAFKDGMYISPFYKLWDISLTTDNFLGNRATGSGYGHQIGATIGYLWQWKNFNTNIGLGYSRLSINEVETDDGFGNKTTESTGGVSFGGLAADLSIGFAF